MQAQSLNSWGPGYDRHMARVGHPPRREFSEFAARLRALRLAAGLTQQQVAERLDIAQSSYALWERRDVALKPDQLVKLAEILGIWVGELLSESEATRRARGPSGRARQAFETLSRLPRGRQKQIVEVVEALVAASPGRRPKGERPHETV
jgi:DNA-binding XRE family transcriptional regulator